MFAGNVFPALGTRKLDTQSLSPFGGPRQWERSPTAISP